MKKLLLLSAAAYLLLNLVGCVTSKPSLTPPANPYIDAYTGGIVSVESVVKVRLAQAYTGAESNAEIAEKLFKFSPSISGTTYWIDANTIGFKPKERLKATTDYEVTFSVAGLYPDAKEGNKEFSFLFSTMQPSFAATIEGLKLYDDSESGVYYLQGIVNAADYAENAAIEKTLRAESEGKEIAIKWQHNDRAHNFEIEKLQSKGEAYKVLLKWNGNPIGYKYAATDTIVVPRKNTFEVLSVKADAGSNKVECVFSGALDAQQKYASYIQIVGVEQLRFSASSNKLEIFLPAKPANQVKLVLREGLKSKDGVALQQDYRTSLWFEELKPAVRLVGKGVIMPNSEGLILPFQSANLKAVDVEVYRTYENNVLQFLQVNNLNGNYEMQRVAKPIAKKTISLDEKKSLDLKTWNTFSIDLASLIAPEPGAIYTVKIRFSKPYSLYSKCAESADNSDEQGDEDGWYSGGWEQRNNPCANAYYSDYYSGNERRFVSQNILASDIGLIAKRGNDKSYLVFVTNLVTAEQMSGVKVMVYDYQQQKIGETVSDSNGVARVGFEGEPYVIVAQQGAQKSYLRIDYGLSLSLSTFDVHGMAASNGLKGMIYGERGVWRPGDVLYLTFVLEDRTRQLPENHPVTFELYNVQNQLVSKQVRTEGKNGFYSFSFLTDPDAPTGTWNAYVKVGGATFSKSLLVATVKPNRFKIDTKLDHDPVLHGQDISGTLTARWLHGAKTSGNKADIKVNFSSVRTTFNKYADYSFDDITKHFSSDEKSGSGTLDDNGMLGFTVPIETNKQSPGKLRATIAVRVFEQGGEFSTDNFAVDVSPYPSYVGLKMPQGDGYYGRLETGKDQTFGVVALDASGKPLKRTLDVEIYRNEWNWWWFSSNGNLADYSHRIYENRIFATKVTTAANGTGAFTYKIDYPDWGLFLVKVTDPESGHSVTQKAYIDWWTYGRGAEDGNNSVAILSFNTDKEKYNVGEKAVVTIPSTDGAKVIVSVENNTRVLSSFRVDCKGKETKVTILTTAEMTPNAYIFVTLLQPHQQTKNDLPMRLYGVIPLPVEDPATHIVPEISMPEIIRPEQPFTVRVKEAGAKEMSYTLAIVDEGLLDLTRFKTPDLWTYFFQREALGVHTWDLYNFVLGAYGGKIEQLFAIGGDDALNRKSGEKANRFKPVVKFVGPFTVAKGKTDSHTFTISNYVGSVRVMLIAGNGSAYGKAEKTVPVRSPLMVQATLPRVLGPGEEVTLPATIFAMEQQVKGVSVELKTNDLFEPLDGATRSLTFTGTGDELVKFKLRVKNKLGVARAKIVAISGEERSEHEIEIEVRAANPAITITQDKIVQGNQQASLSLQLPGMEGTNKAQLEVSSIPPLNLGTRLQYLLSYPHGCLEQTTSGAFPQLYLGEVVELSFAEQERAFNNIHAAIKRLSHFVRPDGSFSYCPGENYVSEWTNNYAGHFLIEAERKGYSVPAAMKNNWIAYQQKAARNWNASSHDNRYDYNQNDLVQAYRLYVLALAKKQELSAMNRLKERKDLSAQAKWMLAGAYSLAGQPEAAKSIVEGLPVNANFTYHGFSDTYGSPERDDAIVLDVLTMTGNKENAFLMAKRISEAMNSDRWMSTQTTAYCLLGLAKFAANEKGGLNFSYSTGSGASTAVASKKTMWSLDLGNQKGTATTVKLENKSGATLFVRLTAKGIPSQGKEIAAENNLKMTVRYIDANNNALDVTNLVQGVDFVAEVKITNPGQRGNYSNLALTQIFPSGWEITENRLEAKAHDEAITYQDIRDDRMLSYFNLQAGRALTIRTKLRSAYVGRFYLPAVACEAMYDAGINANTVGERVGVGI